VVFGSLSARRKLAVLGSSQPNSIGVQELWIIDPDPRLITEHRFGADASVTTVVISESDPLTSPLLPGFVISGTILKPPRSTATSA
jgi:Uma2 family endonuclease